MKLAIAVVAVSLAVLPAYAVEPGAQTPAPVGQPAPGPDDSITKFIRRLEEMLKAGRPDAYLTLISPTADRSDAAQFASANFIAGASDAVVHQSDIAPLRGEPDGRGYRLMVETFVQRGISAQVSTWRVDLRNEAAAAAPADWRIIDQERLTSVEGLYRLALNPQKQYQVRDLTVSAEDLSLRLPQGLAFVAETDFGVTGLVVLGRGEMEFSPAPAAERGQVRLFAGADTLRSEFDSAFIRLNPEEFKTRVASGALVQQPMDRREFKRATTLFEREAPKSYTLDLGALSRDKWWVVPNLGDILFEIKTRRFDMLTYVRSASEPEDIRVFDRKRKRNIAVYTSKEKLAARGPFYNEDEFADFDVLDYTIDASFDPEREWVEGRATLKIRAATNLFTITIRLADALVVQSVTSQPFGRLLPLRAPGQDSLILNFPTTVPKDFIFLVSVAYVGHLSAQRPDHETAEVQQESPFMSPIPTVTPEPYFLYSNRSYWYPQNMVTDYATATLRLRVPSGFECVGSGEPANGSPVVLAALPDDGATGGKRYTYVASQPVRYLAAVVSRFQEGRSSILSLQRAPETAAQKATNGLKGTDGDEDLDARQPGVFYNSLALSVEANPRQVRRGRELSDRTGEIVRFYNSILEDVPYPSFTLTLVDSDLPGGHSPAYFALLKQPLPTSPFSWKGDPVNFDDFPEFFLAHELAHQWWGQAVGWNNYHEQWLSEGIAQYFAAMYAQQSRGDAVFSGILRQMRRYALEYSDQGPVYLGYRLGHIKGQGRVFRALVYNKGALVLHALRRLIGDDAFFRGLRRFYRDWRFKKAGTNDLRKAFEAESNTSLGRFFDRWIFEAGIPRLAFSYRTLGDASQAAPGTGVHANQPGGSEVVLRFEQPPDNIYDVPVTVTLNYASGASSDVVVKVVDSVVEVRVPLTGALRSVDLNRDNAALAEFVRN